MDEAPAEGAHYERTAQPVAVSYTHLALFLLTMLDMLQLWHLYAAGLVMGVNQTVGFPTQQALSLIHI